MASIHDDAPFVIYYICAIGLYFSFGGIAVRLAHIDYRAGVRGWSKRTLFFVFLWLFAFVRFVWILLIILEYFDRSLNEPLALCLTARPAHLFYFSAFSIILTQWSDALLVHPKRLVVPLVILNVFQYFASLFFMGYSIVRSFDTSLGPLSPSLEFFSTHVIVFNFALLALAFLVMGLFVFCKATPDTRRNILVVIVTILVAFLCFLLRAVLFAVLVNTCQPRRLHPECNCGSDLSNEPQWNFLTYVLPEVLPSLLFLWVLRRRSLRSLSMKPDVECLVVAQDYSVTESPTSMDSLAEDDTDFLLTRDRDSSSDEDDASAVSDLSTDSTWRTLPSVTPLERRQSVLCDDSITDASTLNAIEVSVECTLVQHKPAVLVAVYAPRQCRPSDGTSEETLVELGRTEVISGEATPKFCVTFLLPFVDNDKVDLALVFKVFNIADDNVDDLNQQNLMGEKSVSSRALFAAGFLNLFFGGVDQGSPLRHSTTTSVQSCLTALLLKVERRLQDKDALIQSVTVSRFTRCYRFPSTSLDSYIHVEESIQVSPFTFSVPRALLSLMEGVREESLLEARSTLEGLRKSSNNSASFHRDLHEQFLQNVAADSSLLDERKHLKKITLMRAEALQHYKALIDADDSELYDTFLSGFNFKRSTRKSDRQLRCIATNLHSQTMRVVKVGAKDACYTTITAGASAAHAYGFSHKGIRQILEDLQKASEMKDAYRHKVVYIRRQREERLLEAELRLDACVCQAASTLLSCFLTFLEVLVTEDPLKAPTLIERYINVGFLVEWESLLSTHGKESGMLGDLQGAIAALRGLRVVLEPLAREPGVAALGGGMRVVFESKSQDRQILESTLPGSEWNNLTAVVSVPPSLFRKLPCSLSDGQAVEIVCVLFTQGINETQTIANTVGSSDLQDEINSESVCQLRQFYSGLQLWCTQQEVSRSNVDFAELDELFAEIESLVSARGTKNVPLLIKTEEFTRRCHGGRITSCKSAKDRTSMSVTSEQVRQLSMYHGLAPDAVEQAVDLMRIMGVRRENARKNIGVAKYAFNAFQRRLLPSCYRAPNVTIGATVS